MPLYWFELATDLSAEVAVRRIASITREPTKFLKSFAFWTEPRGAAQFVGHVKGCSFWISRDIGYRNSFLPQIHCRVDQSSDQTRLRFVMLMHPISMAFMLLWLCLAAWGTWIGNMESIRHGNGLEFFSIGLFSFGLILPICGFFPEAVIARNRLEAILKARPPSTVESLLVPRPS
jgi:hypothetical protein